jgi:hypothetical protein
MCQPASRAVGLDDKSKNIHHINGVQTLINADTGIVGQWSHGMEGK